MNIFDPQISGSLSVSGSGEISGDLTVLGTLYATISGTAENAVSASHAAKYTLTSSFHQFTASYTTGAFTGSFKGDGGGLYNIPASGVTGLNLSQISQGSATASISQANGLLINTNTEITGNLKVNNINIAVNSLVTINVSDSGGKYFINNVRNPQLTLIKGFTYRFLYPNLGSHPFRFSTTNDGTHNGGVTYSTGVTTGSTPNYIEIQITDSTPTTLYYYCTAHPGMGNSITIISDILSSTAERNIVFVDPSRLATTGSNSFVGSQSISGSASVTGALNITGSITLNGQPIGTGKLDETTFNSYTASNDTRVSALETSTGSLNTFTGSINTTIKNKLNSDGVISGSSQILNNSNIVSSSAQIFITGSADYTTFSTSIDQSISKSLSDSKNYTDTEIGLLDFVTPLLPLEEFSASVNSYTSSNTTNIDAIHTATSSLNTFSSSILGAVEVTGSNLTVKGNLLVKGTTTQVDSTTVTIGDNIIQLNGTAATNAGIVVQDATGASIVSGSLLWDAATDYWKAGKLGSEEKIVLINEYNTFSTSIDSRVSSVQTATASLNLYTSSTNTRLSSIETSTASLNTFTSSTSTRLNSLETASGSIRSDFDSYGTSTNTRLSAIESTTGSLNTFTSSTNTKLGVIESTTSSLNNFTSSTNTKISAIETATSSLNNYTSSTNIRLNSIETSTGSLNTFTSSASGRLNNLETASGSIRSDFNSYTSSTNNKLNSIETSTGSLNSYTSSTNTRLGVIESTTSSLNSHTSSTNNRLSSIETSTGSLNTFTSSANGRLNSLEIASGSIRTDFNSYTSSNNSRINVLESTTSSLNTFTSSANSRINLLETASGSIRSDFNSYTSSTNTSINSINTTTSSLNSYTSSNNTRLGIIESTTGSLNTYTSSTNTRLSTVESTTSSLNQFTSSINTTIKNKLNSDGVISGSAQITISNTTGYNTFSSSLATTDAGQDTRLNSLESKTGSYATTGSNVFQGTQTITGSLFVSQDLVIGGSSSINFVSQSTLNIGTNLITVNAQNPSTRFGGLAVIDSGSSPQVSGSILFDSVNNQWIFIHQNQTAITSSILLMGPQTFNNVGNETSPTVNKIIKSLNDEHLGDSNITDTGTKVSINSNTEITGTLAVTQNISSPNISAIQTATASLNTFSSSILNAIELTGSNLTVKGNLLVKGTTTNVNTTTLDVDNNLINLNGTGATFAGLRVKDTTAPNQVSGSLLWDAANDYWIGGQLGSEQRLVRETEFNNAVTRIGNVEVSTASLNSYTSSTNTKLGVIELTTASLNLYTSSINTRLNLIETSTGSLNTFSSSANTRLNSLESASGSIRTDFNSYTSSNNSTNTTQNNRLNSIESATGSINTFTSSATSKFTAIESTTSSLNTYTSSNTTNINAIHTATSSLNSYTSSTNTRLGVIESTTGSLNSYTSSTNTRLSSIETSTGSLNTFTSSANGRLGAIETTTGSLNSYTSSNTTNINAIHTATSSLNSYTSSTNTRLNSIETATGSLNSYTSSNTTNINAIHTATSSLNSYTSSNTSNINAIHTATASLNSYTSSNTTAINAINTATSSLNTFTSSFNNAFSLSGADVTVRGNFTVSGTTTTVNSTTVNIADNIIQLNGTGATNAGLVVRDATASTFTSGSLLWDTTNDKWIAGPLGAEDDVVLRTASQTLTNKTISGASNTLSNIGNSSLTNSSITIAGTSTSLGGTISAATIGNAIGAFSGSAQVALTGTTGFGTYIDQGLLTTSSPTHAGLTISGRAQIGGTDSRGVLTVQTGSTQTYSANTDPTDAGRFFVMQNTSTTNAASQYSNITLQINPGGTIGSGRVLGDIRLVRNSLNGTSARFIFGAFRDDATYKDYLSLDFAGATFAGTINGLTVSAGTISSGTWNGSSISTTYTDAKITSVAGTANQISVSSSTGAVTFSLPQNINTSATPTFGGLTLAGTGTGNAATLKVNNSSASTFNHSIEAFTANMTAGQTNILVVGASGSTKNSGYIGYNWAGAGSNSNYVSLGHWGADHLLRIYGDGTVYMGTVTTGVWNGSSISTTYTDAKVTSVNAGTGISVNATTGAVTVTNSGVTSIAGTTNQITASASTGGVTLSLPQNIHTGASPTFGGLTISGGATTATFRNTTASSNSNVCMGNDASANGAGIALLGSTFTASGQYRANGGYIYSNLSGGLTLHAEGANSMFLATNGTAAITINSSQVVTFANTISGSINGNAATASAVAWSNVSSKPAAWLNAGNLIDTNAPDTAAPSGFYQYSANDSGNPAGTWFNYVNVRHSNTGNGHGYQIGMSYYDSNLWYRSYQGGLSPTFAAWRRAKDFTNSTYATSFSSVSSVTVTHNLGSKDVMVMCYDSNDDMFWPSNIRTTDTNTVTITFSANRTGRVVVLR